MKETLGQQTSRKYRQMLMHRDGIRGIVETLSKYVLQREAWFGDSSQANKVTRISVKGVDDDTAIECADAAATAISGALWPNVEESFEIVPHAMMRVSMEAKKALGTQECKEYYEEVTQRARQPYASAEAGFTVAWGEHCSEQVTLGTSGIVVEENYYDDMDPVCFRSVSVETSVIDENHRNQIDTVCFEYTMTARQLDSKFEGKISSEVKETLKTDEDAYVKVIHMIRPRPGGKTGSVKAEKPFASIHMEVATEHILKEDGQDELSVFMTRFMRRPGELYGRSLASKALPTIKEMNVIRRAMNLALGKQLDPPVGFRVEQLGGAGTVDLSMGAKVPLYDTGMVPQGRPPVEVLLQVPEPRVANERVTNLEERIMTKFLLDKLLDFNNKTRMTLGEANIRTDFRNQALGPYFSRQMTECLHPTIMFTMKVQWKRKMFGLHPRLDWVEIELSKREGIMPFIMPQVVADFYDATGKLPFAVRFISPAARAMRSDALNGIEKYSNFIMALVNGGASDAMDNLAIDDTCEEYRHHVGAPSRCIPASNVRDENRQARQEAQAQMMELEAQDKASGIEKNRAKAAKDSAQAGVGPMGALGISA